MVFYLFSTLDMVYGPSSPTEGIIIMNNFDNRIIGQKLIIHYVLIVRYSNPANTYKLRRYSSV